LPAEALAKEGSQVLATANFFGGINDLFPRQNNLLYPLNMRLQGPLGPLLRQGFGGQAADLQVGRWHHRSFGKVGDNKVAPLHSDARTNKSPNLKQKAFSLLLLLSALI